MISRSEKYNPYEIGKHLYENGYGISDMWGAVKCDFDMIEAQRGYEDALANNCLTETKMKINYTRRVHETIDLDDDQVSEITRNKLRALIAPGQYLRTENDVIVVKQDDPDWRHGSVTELYVRDATDLDLAVFRVLGNL